jgi:hypothetical protein
MPFTDASTTQRCQPEGLSAQFFWGAAQRETSGLGSEFQFLSHQRDFRIGDVFSRL